jgi:hypothetical protein
LSRKNWAENAMASRKGSWVVLRSGVYRSTICHVRYPATIQSMRFSSEKTVAATGSGSRPSG